ncbi:mitogen-activated protein kinase kinase kinase 7-like [Durio zibethinus]|uniref:Mitogen-activated protein kinase kinase kinase 7-like n=1 Tax=Durio zibethinus TaxID=66656 RepID=A0A6P5YC53_DURZI|nr:mitogen-activated protein kinase kinase kinase 7-like [Durio zibethinus]
MEQFRQIGEVLGSLTALMVLQDDIQINRRQCCLLFDIFSLAFNTIAEEIRMNLKLEEKNTKWNALESPLRELQRIFKEGELYVKQCMDKKDWWVKAINLHQNKDCVDNHIHNLLSHFPAIIEAIETAGEIAGLDQDEMQRRRVALARKYDKEWNDPKLFQFRFGKQYLIPRDICTRFQSAWREDRWNLVEALREKKSSESATKNQQRLAGLLIKKIIGAEAYNDKLFPSSILYGGDYLVRRRLGGQYKEIQWLGDNFVLRHFFGEVEPACSEISTLLSLSHPNILQYLCGFHDEEKKEVMLVLELMNKDLSSYMKENCGSRRRILFSFPVVVDLMFQIARGMEYLHSQKIYHGELNPSNIFMKARNSSEGYFHLKISGYGLSTVKTRSSTNSSPKPIDPSPCIWYAPEVLLEQEQPGNYTTTFKYTEKADVYSFGMLCFELLTGKVPFEDGHLQGEKVSRNIRAGERPLFPYTAPKYLVSLTKRCWHTDPNQRPSFSSICRILRYIKKFLVMNADHDQPELQFPVADYCEIEAWFLKFTANGAFSPLSVAQIPFQMFAYRLAEKDRTILNTKDKNGELAIEAASICRDENNSTVEDPLTAASDTKSVASDVKSVCSDIKSVCSDMRSIYSEIPEKRSINFDTPQRRSICTKIPEKKILLTKKNTNVKAKKCSGTSNGQSAPPPTLNRGHSVRINRESRLPLITSSLSKGRQRAAGGHTSD